MLTVKSIAVKHPGGEWWLNRDQVDRN